MAEEIQGNQNIQAENNSTAVGKIEVGGSIGGDFIIGGTHNYYASPEAAKSSLANETISIEAFEPETLLISEGAFWMGSEAEEGIKPWESPRHEVTLPAYRIGKYPVTNQLYKEFIRQSPKTKISSVIWGGQMAPPEGREDLPVAGVTWYEAQAYCEWLSKITSRKYCLPNEAQWEKACRGGKNSVYPWGDEFDPARCNQGRTSVAPVTKYPAQNEFGCFDLVGNVMQWTCTLWGKMRASPHPKYSYPWQDDGRNNPNDNPGILRVIRGSSMNQDAKGHRCSVRRGEDPGMTGIPGARYGFRVAMNFS